MKVYEAMNILSKANAEDELQVHACVEFCDFMKGRVVNDLFMFTLDVSEITLEDDPVILAGC